MTNIDPTAHLVNSFHMPLVSSEGLSRLRDWFGGEPLSTLPAELTVSQRQAIARQHAMLRRGTDPLASLRAWYTLTRFRNQEGAFARFRVLLAGMASPILSTKHAWRSARQHGVAVRARYGVSRTRQFADQWRLRVLYGVEPDMYYGYRLHLPDRRAKARFYLPLSPPDRLMRLLAKRIAAADAEVVSDKRRFARWCGVHGFPAIGSIIEVEPDGKMIWCEGSSLPSVSLFAKVTNLRSGKGARAWTWIAPGCWSDEAGESVNEAAIVAQLRDHARRLQRPIVLQRRLVNHRDLRAVTNGSLSTIRVVTIRPREGAPETLLAVYRMAVGASITDNLTQGGMAAPVDLRTGELGRAVRINPPLFDECDVHPQTHARISGTTVPHWESVLSVALAAHSALSRIFVVGWDIAILEDGPVIVEANVAPGSRLSQIASGEPLGQTRFAEGLEWHLRRSFGLPGVPEGGASL